MKVLAGLALLLVAAGVGACEDKSLPRVAAASHVAEDAPNRGALWPILLQHCLRSPSCDPMSQFGEGVGQASGVSGATTYFVESADVVKEDGRDYGGKITLSLLGARGDGGPAGRPLTLDETPSDLRATKSRQSWLSIEYRAPPPTGAPEPYFLALRSAQVALAIPGVEGAKARAQISAMTGDALARWSWGKDKNGADRNGAKIELSSKAGAVFTGYSIGLASTKSIDEKTALRQRFEPWIFYVSRNLRDDKADLAPLMKAIATGETLNLAITAPGGGVILRDVVYTGGFEDALKAATAALKDTRLAQPITERCAIYVGQGTEVWTHLDAPPASRTCDPRSPEQLATPPPKPSAKSDDELRAIRDRAEKEAAERAAPPR